MRTSDPDWRRRGELPRIGPGGFLDGTSRLLLEHGSLHLWRLGPRAVEAFNEEAARAHDLLPETLARLARYERLTISQIVRSGADRFPPRSALPW